VPTGTNTAGVSMKDMDFVKFGRAIKLGSVNRDLFLNQLERDVDFLESHGICDYSLLVGIHFRDRDLINKEKSAPSKEIFNPSSKGSFFKKDYGGIYSVVSNRPGNEIYFIGLIDILTTYDLKKKAEHVLKSVKNLNNVMLLHGLCI
jgi:hypothetical protein